MYECEAENQFKVSKNFINIDGKKFYSSEKEKILFFLETIFFNTTTTTRSPSYGRFHYIWQMEIRLAL
jgi:hypothetical protein